MTILFLAALILTAIGLAAVLSVGDFAITNTPRIVHHTDRPEWRLTDDEIRAKELRLIVGRDATGCSTHPRAIARSERF
jgi:hypothetical protein